MTDEELAALEHAMEHGSIERGPVANRLFERSWIVAKAPFGGCVVTTTGQIARLEHLLEAVTKDRDEYKEMVEHLDAMAQHTVSNANGEWDCVCSNDPPGIHEHGCPAGLRSEIQPLVEHNELLRFKLHEAERERYAAEERHMEAIFRIDELISQAEGAVP